MKAYIGFVVQNIWETFVPRKRSNVSFFNQMQTWRTNGEKIIQVRNGNPQPIFGWAIFPIYKVFLKPSHSLLLTDT